MPDADDKRIHYEVYGPFELPEFDDPESKSGFWERVEDSKAGYEGLSRAVGVYVVSTRWGKKYTPWYVGMTNAKSGFKLEVFTDHKLDHYRAIAKNGARCMHLIAKTRGYGGDFCRGSRANHKSEIDTLETMIIGMAWRVNKQVENKRKLSFLQNCYVPGLIGDESIKGRPTSPSSTLRKVFRSN